MIKIFTMLCYCRAYYLSIRMVLFD